MDEFDKIILDLTKEGYDFKPAKTLTWGERHTGVRKKSGVMGDASRSFGGLLKSVVGGDERIYVARFLASNPDIKRFADFLTDAEKWLESIESGEKVDRILVVTPTKFDKKSIDSLLRRSEEVKSLLAWEVAAVKDSAPPARRLAEKESQADTSDSQPAPRIQKPEVTHIGYIDVKAIQEKLRDPALGEEVLYVWEGDLLQTSSRITRTLLAVTQERGMFFRQFDGEYVNTGPEFRWERVTHLEGVMDGGTPILVVNDGQALHRFANAQAGQIARLMYHLRSYREGMRTGFIKERRFDQTLADSATPNILQGRYLDAVRVAYTLLESRIRDFANAGAIGGHELIDYAFQKDRGVLRYGRDDDEKLGLYMLFEGAFKWSRNPATHNYYLPNYGRDDALEELSMVNLLLKLAARGRDESRGRSS